MRPHLEITPRPELRVTPALIQAMEVVALPQVELEARVWDLLEENPFLEVDEERWRQEMEYQEDEVPWWERVEDRGETLQEHLERQLDLADAPSRVVAGARALLFFLDSRGFLTRTLEELAEALPFSPQELEEGRRLLATLDPLGCGAMDVRESLLFQVQQRHPGEEKLIELLTRGWELLVKGMRGRLATRLRVSPQELEELVRRLGEFTPYPGVGFASRGESPGIRPDVFIEYVGEEPVVYLARDGVPPLRVNRLSLRGIQGETAAYLRAERARALGLVRGVILRRRYLRRLGQILAEVQRDFFLGRRDSPLPLSVGDVAETMGISENTVNRLVAGKYLHSPRGTMALRSLLKGERMEVKELIRALIEEEDPRSPLGDDKIAERLRERGYQVARRTVAKYREEMGIPSSRKRKKGKHL